MKKTVALIGCGAISKKHLSGISENSTTLELVAVCDRDRGKAEQFAAAASDIADGKKEAAVFTDVDSMLSAVDPEIVAIATSSSSHYELSVKSLEKGAHVIVEKPMALSTSEAEKMIECAEQKKRKLAVCYISRFAPHFTQLHEAVKNNRFGKILHLSINVYWNRNEAYYKQAGWRGKWENDGGALMNQCTHAIDLLQWLSNGDLEKIYGVLRRYQRPIEAEDFGTAIVEFDNDVVGTIVGSVNVYPKNLHSALHLFGEQGTVAIGGNALNEVAYWTFKDGVPFKEPAEGVPFNGYRELYRDFVQAVDQDREPFINGHDGKKSVEIVLGIYNSMQSGKPVEPPIAFSTAQMKSELL